MNYEVYKVSLQCLEDSLDQTCNELKAYPKGNLGLTLDSAKDDRWRELRKVKDVYLKAIKRLNRLAPKSFLLKARDERRAKRIDG